MTSFLTNIKDFLHSKSRGVIPEYFDLNQKLVLHTIDRNNVISILKSRQSGMTSVILYYVAHLMRSSYDRKEIAFIGASPFGSTECLTHLGFLLRGYPEDKLRGGAKDLHLEGSCFRTFNDYYKLRGSRFDVIIIDEAAYHQDLENILMYSSQSLVEGGKLICLSSTGGMCDMAFKNFHLKLSDALSFYKKDLLIEKKHKKYSISNGSSVFHMRAPHLVDVRCYKNPSTELKKEKLNIY